ncbi:hypothetical protein [Nanchangia anserum]|uniref:Uncharacterized protein n=1 Tax=Nanchangia anserum TaxID=2692125 RepID=A0A8I0GBQ7_9ACTO|nr:hypothetical protein [Nanchangia anserum]MBD3688638.1 hypothetical protein [Nanchangia anserum]
MSARHVLYGVAGALVARRLVSKRIHLEGPHLEWERQNYAGRTVSLEGGVVTAAGLTALGIPTALISGHVGAAQLVAAGAGGVLGYVDDTETDPGAAKGFAGHLGALARGEVTTGALKILGIGAGAAAAAVALARRRGNGSVLDWTIDTILIASSANVANLLDLRPGRALKTAAIVAAGLARRDDAGGALAAGTLAISVAQLPGDLDEREMLGDTGANALGATIGVATAAALPRGARVCAAGIAVAAMVASEKISFSRVIEATPLLRHLDSLGRRADA